MSTRAPAPLVVLLVAGCTAGSPEATPTVTSTSSPLPQHVTVRADPPETVEEVIDGRTVLLSNGVRARVLGLGAPGECWSAAALAFARETLLGKQVHYSRASEALITLRLNNNDDYATLAVSRGAMRADPADPVLTEAEKSAAQTKVGLWGAPCHGQDTTPPSPQRDACTLSYRVAKEWAGGFHAEIIIRNNTPASVMGWTLRWTFPSGQKIGYTWNMTARQDGPDVTATSPGIVHAGGGTVSVRFNATTPQPNVAPSTFTFNGKPCATS